MKARRMSRITSLYILPAALSLLWTLAGHLAAQDIDPASDANTRPYRDVPGAGYCLAFSDEFNTNVLNSSKWNYRTGTRFDGVNLPGNVALSNSMLHIYGRNETNVVGTNVYSYTCGGVISKQLLGYGYYEIRATLNSSNVPGWHQSFWNMNLNEVDGFEIPSYAPRKVGLNLHYYPGGVHYGWGMDGTGNAYNYMLPDGLDSSQSNHIYGWEYSPSGVNWFVDGVKVKSSTYPGPLQPANLWLTSLAWNEGGAGIVAPSDMQVDYFRFFTNTAGYGDALPAGLLVDITNAAFVGSWTTDSYALNFDAKSNTRTSTNNGSFVTWTPNIANAGTYEVLVWNPTYFQRRGEAVIAGARQATFVVTARDGAHATQPVDQLYGGQKWFSLGSFPFNSGTSGSVRLEVTNGASTSIFRAGAVVFRPITNAPAAPTGLKASDEGGFVSLAWNPPVGWAGFTIKRATVSGGPYSVIAAGVTNRESYDDLTALLGMTYYYVAAATNTFGSSADSTEAAVTVANDLIKDDADTTGIGIAGTWASSTGVPGYYGADYLYASPGTGASVRFTPVLPRADDYQVYVRWTAYPNRPTNLPVEVSCVTGIRTNFVNQTTNNGIWNWLGKFPFNAGTNGSVVVRSSASGYAVADAVRWVEGVSLEPVAVAAMVSGTNAVLSWPPDHTGWRLQTQTNHLGTNWYEVAGSNATNVYISQLDQPILAAFFRLIYP